jgi:Protein of unknown function (DUF3309)
MKSHANGTSLAQPLLPLEPMLTILLIVLFVMMIGSAPAWPHSRGWGYYPSGGLGLVLLIVLLVVFLGPHRVW